MEVSAYNIALYSWLQPFLEKLKANGFTISPDTHIQLLRVLHGMSGKINSSEDLFHYIAPVIVKSGEQLSLFREAFQKYAYEHGEIAAKEITGSTEKKEAENTGEGVDKKWWQKNKKLLSILFAIVAVLAILFFIFHPPTAVSSHTVVAKYQVQFTNISKPVVFSAATAFSDPADTVYAGFQWDFGDGDKDSSGRSTVLHHYTKAGVYKTSLVIIDKANKLDIESPYVVQELRLCKPQIFLDSDAGIELALHDSTRFFPVYDASFPPGDSNTWLLNGQVIQRNATELTWKFDSAGLQTITYIDENYVDTGDCANNQADKPIYVKPPTNITADIIQSGEPVTPPVRMNGILILIAAVLLALSIQAYLWSTGKLKKLRKLEKLKPEDILAGFKGTKPPYEIPFRNYEDIIDDEPYISRLARNLKRRMPDESSYINIPVTIRETIKSEGLIIPFYSYHTRPVEYLVLIDRTRTNNQQVKLYEYLLKRLIKTDLFVEIFYYSGSPATCVNQKYPNGIKLSRLFDLYARHVLIIFSEGNALIKKAYPALDEQYADIIKKWEHRILVTPKPQVDWDYKEKILQELFEVLPADLEGQLLLFAKQEGIEANFQEYMYRLQHGYSLQPFDFYEASDLQSYLDDSFLFQWLCSLAVYPALHWSVILAIGDELQKHAFPRQSINYSMLLKLVRIPWMADGSMPDDTRLELLKMLDPAHELIARKTMIKLMNEAAAKLNDQSFVYEQLEMQRITDKFMLYAQDPNDPEHLPYQRAYGQFKMLWNSELIPDVPLSEYLKKEDNNDWSTLIGNRNLSKEPAQSAAIDEYLDDSVSVDKKRWKVWKRVAEIAATVVLAAMLALAAFKNQVNSTFIDRALHLTEINEDYLVPISFGYIADECFSGIKAGRDSAELILSIGEEWAMPLPQSDTVIYAEVPYEIYKLGEARLIVNSSDPQYVLDTTITLEMNSIRVQYMGCPVICNNWQRLVNNSVPQQYRGNWYNAGVLIGSADTYAPFTMGTSNINSEKIEQVFSCASDTKLRKLISKDEQDRFKAYVLSERNDPQRIGLYYFDRSFETAALAMQYSSKATDLASFINFDLSDWTALPETELVQALSGVWNQKDSTLFELDQEKVRFRGANVLLQNIRRTVMSGKNIYSAVFTNSDGYGDTDSTQLYIIPIDTNRIMMAQSGLTGSSTDRNTSTPVFVALTRDASSLSDFQAATLPIGLNEIWSAGAGNGFININLAQKNIYYGAKDIQSYSTYPITEVAQRNDGVYRIISQTAQGYKVFFLDKISSRSFQLSVCQPLYNNQAQVQRTAVGVCEPYKTMRPYYPSNNNRIYLPNNSRSLYPSERKKLSNYSRYLNFGNYRFQAYVNNEYLNNLSMDAISKMLEGLDPKNGTIIHSFRSPNSPFGRSYVEITPTRQPFPNTDDYKQDQKADDNIAQPNKPPRLYLYKNTEQFKSMLEDVIAGSRVLNDFEKYLCDGGETIVYVNGVRTTFSSLYKSLYKSKRHITEVQYQVVQPYDDGSRCVKQLLVKHKPKSIF